MYISSVAALGFPHSEWIKIGIFRQLFKFLVGSEYIYVVSHCLIQSYYQKKIKIKWLQWNYFQKKNPNGKQNSLFLYSFQSVTDRLLLSTGIVLLLTGKQMYIYAYICVYSQTMITLWQCCISHITLIWIGCLTFPSGCFSVFYLSDWL